MSFQNGLERLESEKIAILSSDAYKRLQMLFDEGIYTELDRFSKNGDHRAEVVTAYGYVNGSLAYAFSQDISVISGAMGMVQAAKIKRVYELAAKTGAPVIGIYDSNGAHLTEGVDTMSAFGELILSAGNLSGVVPQISLVLGPCIGSAAILASLADIIIMSEKSELYVVSGDILGDKEGKIGSAKNAAENGTASIVTDSDSEAINSSRELISMLPSNNLSMAYMTEYVPAASVSEILGSDSDVADIISAFADAESFLELSKEYADCAKTGFARIGGYPVGVVATDASVNDGRLCASGCTKISRFVRMCDAFTVPVITLLNCNGFSGTEQAELRGDMKNISMLTHSYSEATTPKITIITGNAIGAAFIAMAGRASNSDVVFAWPDAVVSSLEPITAISVLYADKIAAGENREQLAKEYSKNEASPFTAAAAGYIDDIIKPDETVQRIISSLEMLAGKRVSTFSKKHSNIPL